MAQWINLSEQRIRIVDANYILCEKNWTRTRSRTGSYGRQAGGKWQTDLPTHPHCADVTRIEGSSPAHTLKMHITRIKLNFVFILLTVLSKETYTHVINT